MRWSSYLMPDCRRSRYSAVPKARTVTARATVYQRVSRRRMVVISGFHDVPDAPTRVHQLLRVPGIDLLAQAVDDHIDDVSAWVEVVIPGVLGDESTRHNPPRVAHQV